MRCAVLAGIALAFSSFAASAAPITPLEVIDLDGNRHRLPAEWREGGVLILGFSHDARAAMDQWVSDLDLRDNAQNWIEAPVIGAAAPALARPMIRSSMRSRYSDARRAHIAPVFENADALIALVGPHAEEVVVLVLNPAGEIVARTEGASTAANIAAIRSALRAP